MDDKIFVAKIKGYFIYKTKTGIDSWVYFYEESGVFFKIFDTLHGKEVLEAVLKDMTLFAGKKF